MEEKAGMRGPRLSPVSRPIGSPLGLPRPLLPEPSFPIPWLASRKQTCIPLVKIPGASLYPGTRTSQANRSGLGKHLYHLPLSRGHREAMLCPDISFSLTKSTNK